ncbi:MULTISPECIES: hypothetical protein [unclassified Gemella]|uniref:hypothetical protein n=1 Tax=unclassified Gemella TaxID=2624949 RepID=UPI0015D05D48|nr:MULTISPECIES: hypothetical protein [unclassified Gemella]MBF0709732.1 hypothetical protein [Gemella sp. GL1.1]NYS27076.1 hypothetical protein [Gemella sp. GL1]
MSENIQTQTDQSVNTGGQVEQQEKTFTQEQVNGFVAKEVKSAQEKFLRDLGIEDFESAKQGLEQFKAYQESQKSEAEKQSELLNNTTKELEQERTRTKYLEASLSALKQGVNTDSVEDVIALAERLVTDEKDISLAISEVLAKYPHFGTIQEVKKEVTPTITVGGNPNGNGSNPVTDPFQKIIDSYKRK